MNIFEKKRVLYYKIRALFEKGFLPSVNLFFDVFQTSFDQQEVSIICEIRHDFTYVMTSWMCFKKQYPRIFIAKANGVKC